MANCCKCDAEIPLAYEREVVTRAENMEYPELKVGTHVCALCWHAIKFPTLVKNRYDDDVIPPELEL